MIIETNDAAMLAINNWLEQGYEFRTIKTDGDEVLVAINTCMGRGRTLIEAIHHLNIQMQRHGQMKNE